MSDPLLTARQVADMLGFSTETVLRWTRAGQLPGFRLPGGQLRYRLSEIEAWLNGHATAGPVVGVASPLSTLRGGG